jgi:hypothetical protein
VGPRYDPRSPQGRTATLRGVRYVALLVLGIVFLTGLVWWVFFIGNALVSVVRRK